MSTLETWERLLLRDVKTRAQLHASRHPDEGYWYGADHDRQFLLQIIETHLESKHGNIQKSHKASTPKRGLANEKIQR